jgi:hypothetical protein
VSVDFYVALPAGEWPTTAAVERCLHAQQYPIQIKRFPKYDPSAITTDGILITIDEAADAYLEGEVFSESSAAEDVAGINDAIASTGGPFRISDADVIISMRTRSPGEMRAASYLISSFIICFNGYGFEPQGNTHGRAEFVQTLVAGAEALKGL